MGLVFQYGSNATTERLNSPDRLGGVAQDLGCAQTIDDFDIVFDVYSQTNGCAASDLVPTSGRKVWGVLYQIPDDFIRGARTDRRKTLAQIEGSRYEENQVRVREPQGGERDAVTFVVKQGERRKGLATSATYVSWIVSGLRDHGVPEDYLAHVVATAVATNKQAADNAAEQTRLILSAPPATLR
jgi:cation transport regulator ChaC